MLLFRSSGSNLLSMATWHRICTQLPSQVKNPSTCSRFSPNSLDPPHIPTHRDQNGCGVLLALTRHRLILFCWCQHWRCAGLNSGIRVGTSWLWQSSVFTSNQFHAMPNPKGSCAHQKKRLVDFRTKMIQLPARGLCTSVQEEHSSCRGYDSNHLVPVGGSRNSFSEAERIIINTIRGDEMGNQEVLKRFFQVPATHVGAC